MAGYATQVTVEMSPAWYHVVRAQLLPQARQIAADAQEYIEGPDGAPVGGADDPHPGQLRAASFAHVDEDGVAIDLGVDLARAPWGLYVIKGTANAHANDYIGRAAEHALQTQRARGAL